MDLQGRTNAKRHIEFTAKKLQFDVATQTGGVVGDKRPMMNSGIFFFNKHPLYISFAKSTERNSKKTRVSGSYNRREGTTNTMTLSGDMMTVYSLETSGSLLERFIAEVAAERVSDVAITPVYTVANLHHGPELYACQIKSMRPSSTIDLDAGIKNSLLSDVEKFLAPGRREWYGKLGIPYKRGILLNGPPGTGKSSIALALAGHINAPLYTIAIGQVIDEGHLRVLFDKVGPRSVVLLEDVDSAGLIREKVVRDDMPRGNAFRGNESDSEYDETDGPPHDSKSRISLSGLLNAIDALGDGVILLMTTNEPESLDKALIRPGRIDKQVRIGCASQAVAASTFKRLYEVVSDEGGNATDESARISELATQFAEKIPKSQFTPAEIQGYLIPLSDSPDEAIAGAEQFVLDLSAAKAAGKNIIGEDAE